jgi:hypothetical protein
MCVSDFFAFDNIKDHTMTPKLREHLLQYWPLLKVPHFES